MSKITTFLVTLFLATCALTTYAQPNFTITPQAPDATVGDMVTVDVTVSNFTDLVGFQFFMNWDETLIDFQGLSNVSSSGIVLVPPPSPANFGVTQTGNGLLTCLWTDAFLTGVSVPDGTVLFSITFEILAAGGNVEFITFSNTEITDNTFTIVPGDFVDGPATQEGYNSSGGGGDPCAGASGFTLVTSSDTVATGAETCLQVQTCGFTNISSFQYTHNFNPSILQYSDVQNFGLAQLNGSAFGTTNVSNGVLTVAWFLDSTATSLSLPDATVLYEVCFNAVGAGGSVDSLLFANMPTPIEVNDGMGNMIPFTGRNGGVLISGTASSALTVGVEGATGMNGDNVCLDVTAENFENLVSMQYSMGWDETVLAFDEIVFTGGLTPLNASNFNTTPALVDNGQLTFSWNTDQINGTTIADGTVMYQVCFDIIGAAGQSSTVAFTDMPTSREAFEDGNTSPIPFFTLDNSVNVIGAGLFTLQANDQTTAPGDTVCVPVTAMAFNQINSFQFSMSWDPAVLEFVEIEQVALSPAIDGVISSFSPSPGQLGISWLHNSPTVGGTLMDGDTVYNVCFRVLGADGSTSSVAFTSSPISIEIGDINSPPALPFNLIDGTVTVMEMNTLAVNDTTVTNIACNGESTGAIDITVEGGTPNYSFSWDFNSATSEDLTDLPVGTYTVTITDNDGLSIVESYTITEPTAITSTLVSSATSCFDSADGVIDLEVSGGTVASDYTYAWSSGAGTAQDPIDVAAGRYYVTITDDNSCMKIDSVDVSQPDSLDLQETIMDVSCNGGSNGSVAVTVAGGTGPYDYDWSINVHDGNSSATSLNAGTIVLRLTDNNGCVNVKSYVVGEPTAIDISSMTTDVSCDGSTLGTIDLTVTGGTGPYTYSWSGSLAAVEDPTDVPVGDYDVTVTDNNGCTEVSSASVTQQASFTVNVSTTDANCNGGGSGSIMVDVSGSTGALTFNWSDSSFGNTGTVSNVSPGNYDVTISDQAGCELISSANVGQLPAFTVSSSAVDVTCNGGTNGSIDLTVMGATGALTYNWNAGGIGNVEDPQNIGANNYEVSITDETGCEVIEMIDVNQPAAVTVTATATDVNCNGNSNGTINLMVGGGTPGYTYTWSDPSLNTLSNPTGLSGGTYIVTVADINNCQAVETINVVEPSVVGINATVMNETIPNANNGSISVTGTGGTPGYTFGWNDGSTMDNRTNLSPGQYDVTVTDANGCTFEATYIINAGDAPEIAVISVNDPTCNNGTDGSIQINVTGGTPPYSYMWSDGAMTPDLENVGEGSYMVTVTDNNGATAGSSMPIILTDPAPITLTATTSDAVCNGEATGSISLTVNGGTAPYTYNWTNGLPGSSNQTNVSANSYDVTVTDFNGCTASTTVVVGEPSAISITSQVVTDALCAGEASGAIDINVSGGTAPYSYAWSNLDTDEDITNITSGNYVVTITDAANCEFISGNIVVGESSDIVISNVNIQDASCFGTATGAISIDVTGGAGNYLYSWENNVPTPISNSEDLTGLRGGTYSLTVTDGNGCIEILSGLFVNEPADISISTNVSNTSIANNDGAINTDITGGTSPYDYNWFSTTGGGFSSDEEDIVGLMPGYYALTVTDANDCTQSVDSVLVEGVVMATAIVSDVNCNGGDDGMIDVTPTGGIAPFSYLWNDNATLEDRDGLSAGTWSVTITDAVGTTFMQSYTIDEPVAMAFQSVNVIGETGTGCNGSINISVTGGSLPYSYQWSNGASSEDVTDLCKGNYSVTVIDAKGCIVIRNQINVAAGALSIANLDVEDAKCFGGSDGSATISILGGCEPYTFTLDNGSTTTITTNTATFDGLSAGTYNVEIVDVNSTSISVPFTIGEGSPVIVTVENVINNSDDTGADCNGAIQISATGGSGNYSYSWNNGMTSEDIEGLCETLSPYSVTVTDENGCTGTLEGITMRRIITEVQDTRCFDECNGEIRLDIVGGNPPYSYVWSDGETGSIRTSLCAGPYEVTVTDNLGDIVHIATNFVDGPSDPINITVDALGQPLGNTSTGSIGISVDGGWGNYTIQWQGPNGFISTVEDIVALEEGAYVVTVIDENGCSESESIFLEAKRLSVADIEIDNPDCESDCNGTIEIDIIEGGTAPYSFFWSDGSIGQAIGGLCAGEYTVTVTDFEGLTEEFGPYVIEEPTPIELSFLIPGNGTASMTITGGTTPYDIKWNTENSDTTSAVSVSEEGVYAVIVTDANGCTAFNNDVFITIADGNPEGGICSDVRAVITPNDDGQNDEFIIRCSENVVEELRIFNRYGQLVFESDAYDDSWMGTNDRNSDLPEGGYFYVLEYVNAAGQRLQEKGHITIIR